MKKSLFAIFAVAAIAAGCSKVVESPVLNNEISFDSYVGKDAMTKATVVTGEGITSVNVNAYLHSKETTNGAGFISNFMTNQAVAKDGSYAPAKYWPAVDQAVDFVAWVPVDNASVANATLTFTVPEDVTKQTDLLVAAPALDLNRAGNNSEVNLTFSHLLSRIGFQINATGVPGADDNTTKVELQSITLNGKFASEGTVDMTAAAPAVVGEASETAYILSGSNFGYADNIITNAETPNKDDSYIMLIPSNNEPTNITVIYTVTTLNGEGVEDDVKIENKSVFNLSAAYEAGKAYKYIFNITMEAISFEVVETPWGNETEVDITPGKTETPENGEQE